MHDLSMLIANIDSLNQQPSIETLKIRQLRTSTETTLIKLNFKVDSN